MLGGDEEFAGEGRFGGAATEGFFGGDADEVGIIVFLRDVRENEVARDGVKAFGVGKIFTYSVIGKMARAGEHALFDDPRIRANFEHVEIVIGFEKKAVGAFEMDFDQFGHVAKVGDEGHLCTIRPESETDRVGGVVGNGEGMDVNIADGKMLAGVNGFDAVEPLAKSFRKNALKRAHGGLSDVERSFPEAKHLWEAVAVVGVLVGDEDAVNAVDILLDGGEAGESFAFAKAAVHEEAGVLRLE